MHVCVSKILWLHVNENNSLVKVSKNFRFSEKVEKDLDKRMGSHSGEGVAFH
jgi:hypothetical protein